MFIAQPVADGFGADEIVVDVTAPQILRPGDAQCPGGSDADQGLGRQEIKISAVVKSGVVAATELEPQDVRQPTGQRVIGVDFVLGRLGADRVGDYQFLAVCWGHASPFNRLLMNVVEGVQRSSHRGLDRNVFQIRQLLRR
jgi:hypothetical protein